MEPSVLASTWFVLLSAIWVLYLVLGGADLGVGQLLHRVDRRRALRLIGPTWAANDVWLVIAIAVTLGAFPGWYAALLEGAYLPFVVFVAAVMARHAGIELIGHATPRRQRQWTVVIGVTSIAIPFMLGLIWAGALTGALAAGGSAGLGLLTPSGVLAGAALTVLVRAQGLALLRLRLPEAREAAPARRTVVVAAGLLTLSVAVLGEASAVPLGTAAGVLLGLALLGVIAALRAVWLQHPGALLAATSAMIVGAGGSLLASLHRTPIAGPGPQGVTLAGSAAGDTTLGAMLAIAAIVGPLLLGLLAYAYVRFLQGPAPETTRRRGWLARATHGTLDTLR